jgi:hypothetical protein
MTPRARTAGLEIVDHASGLLIRDRASHAEHSLHPLTAFVWKNADGHTPVADLAARAASVVGHDVTEQDVWAAIDVLTGARLLEGRIAPPAGTQRVGRRDLLRNLAAGSVAAVAVGAVTGATAEAQSPASEEQAEKKFERIEERLEERAQERATKFEDRLAEESAAKQSREDSRKTHSDFQDVILDPLWVNVGDPFAPATFVNRGGVVTIIGHVTLSADPAGEGDPPTEADPPGEADPPDPDVPVALIGTLPEGSRPDHTLVFSAFSDGPLRHSEVHITSAGQIFVIGEPPTSLESKKGIKKGFTFPSLISLSGMSFPIIRGVAGGGHGSSEAQEQLAKARQAREQSKKQEFNAQKGAELEHKKAQERLRKVRAQKRDAEQDQKHVEHDQKAAEQDRKQEARQQEHDAKQSARQAEQDQKRLKAQEQRAKQAAERDQKQAQEDKEKLRAKEQANKQAQEVKSKSSNQTPSKPVQPKPPVG